KDDTAREAGQRRRHTPRLSQGPAPLAGGTFEVNAASAAKRDAAVLGPMLRPRSDAACAAYPIDACGEFVFCSLESLLQPLTRARRKVVPVGSHDTEGTDESALSGHQAPCCVRRHH